MLIITFLATAHFAVFMIWTAIAERDAVLPSLGRHARLEGALLFVAGATVSAYIVFWALEGFYDSAALALLMLCARSLAKRSFLPGLAWFALAIFVHLRALYMVPWAFYALAQIVRTRAWRDWRSSHWFLLAVTSILIGAALVTAALTAPGLRKFPIRNVIYYGHFEPAAVACVVAVIGLLFLKLVQSKSWLDLSMLIWSVFLLAATRQTQWWHGVVLLAWWFGPLPMGVDSISRRRLELARAIAIATLVAIYGASTTLPGT